MQDIYTPEQGETYLEWANDQVASGNYADALQNYSNALQVVRVVEGLNSLNQIPVLRAQLKIYEKMRQWDRYDETLGLIYMISQEQLPVGDERRVEALNQLGKWNLRATEEGLLENLSRDADDIVELYEQELRQIEHSGTANISDFAIASLKLGESYARLAQARNTIKKPLEEYRSLTSRPTLDRTPCRNTRRGARGDTQSCMEGPKPNLSYYKVPQRKKDREVRDQLEALRLSILDAASTLEEKREFPDRSLLVEQFRFLAESYTGIVSR